MKKSITTFATAFVLFATAAVLATSAFAQGNPASGTKTTPPEEFKPSGAFSMQFFGDYYYQIGADTAASRGSATYASTKKDYQAFDIRRVYLGYDYHFTPNISAQLLLAHENGSPSGDVVIDANRGLYIKAANIRFKNVLPYSTLVFGQQGMPFFAVDESVWGYRSIEKSVMDMRGFAGSNDLGIQLMGGFDQASTIGYAVAITNGNGAKAENNKYKKYTGDLNAKLMDNHIVLDVAADHQDLSTTAAVTTIKGFVGYQSAPIVVGVVYGTQTTTNSAAGATDLTRTALSVFARGFIIEKELNWFARYDMYTPNTDGAAKVYKENFITAGLDWIPDAAASNVHVMPNVWIDSYGEQNGLAKRDADVVGRLTFFYKF